MNLVVLTGRIVKDNELRTMTNGKEVLNNTIAVRNDFKNEDGEYSSQFINIVLFGQTATYISQFAPKGSTIEVVGRWQHRSYQDNQGNTKYVDECIVDRASILISKQEEGKQEEKPEVKQKPKQDDDPFSSPTKTFNDDELPF